MSPSLICNVQKNAEVILDSNQTFTVNGVSFTMMAVKGGAFTMGDVSTREGMRNLPIKLL